MEALQINQVIPETNIVMFTPHYDDFLLGLGGYVLELKARRLLHTKKFHILLIFSRSNYQIGSGKANFDTSLERIKFATGIRLLEEMDCLDELLGERSYRYELRGERECMLRAKVFADSKMEFPHGMYEDFNAEDQQIFDRTQELVRTWATIEDAALVFPLAIKEHIDHFITREAGIRVAKEMGKRAKASFYFLEDKPYAGIADPQEAERIEAFTRSNKLQPKIYTTHPEEVVQLAFKYYISQVEEVYRKGTLQRAVQLQELYSLDHPCERLFVFPRSGA